MIGTKLYKNNEDDMAHYTDVAIACNQAGNLTIEDKGEYYEVVEIPAPSLEELKEAKFTEIKNAYLEELYAPVWFEQTMAQPNGETGPKKYVGYDTDQNSQIDFNSSYKRAQLKGSTLYNIYVNPDDLKEKEFTYHTPEMFDAALLAAGEYQEKVYVKYYTVKAQVEAATTKEELEAIQWS